MSSLPPGYDDWLLRGPGGPHDDREGPEAEGHDPELGEVAVCMGCNCNDLNACETPSGAPCYWLRIDEELLIGVCSECPDFVAQFDAGERGLPPAPDEPRLITPGDPEFDATLRHARQRA